MGMSDLIGKLFGAKVSAPPDATKLDATTEVALAQALSGLPAGEKGWITLTEAQSLFSAERAEYAFGELDHPAEKRSKRSRRSTNARSTLCRCPSNGSISSGLNRVR
jgi:hypothetical protein